MSFRYGFRSLSTRTTSLCQSRRCCLRRFQLLTPKDASEKFKYVQLKNQLNVSICFKFLCRSIGNDYNNWVNDRGLHCHHHRVSEYNWWIDNAWNDKNYWCNGIDITAFNYNQNARYLRKLLYDQQLYLPWRQWTISLWRLLIAVLAMFKWNGLP